MPAAANANAPYGNDFVELFNRGSASVDLGGWSIQYASGSGTSWQPTALSGSVQPGGHYLVQLASGGPVGAALPAPDATGTSNLAVSGGKVALAHATIPLGCGSTAGSCSPDPLVADLVGYGSATDYEGAGAAPAIGNTTAALRAGDGCTDTDVNSSDLSAAAPTPRNSAAAAAPCSAPPPPSVGVSQSAPVDIDVDAVLTIALERPSISFGHAAAGETPTPVSERVTVATNQASGYALAVHRSAFVPADLPLGLSAAAPPGGQLAARPLAGAEVAVRLRLGVVVVVRAPGALVRRLELRRLRVARRAGKRLLQLVVANAGNVTEALRRVRLVLSRAPTGRRLETLVAGGRELRPQTRGVLEFRLHARARGVVTARAVIPGEPGRAAIHRTFRLRL